MHTDTLKENHCLVWVCVVVLKQWKVSDLQPGWLILNTHWVRVYRTLTTHSCSSHDITAGSAHIHTKMCLDSVCLVVYSSLTSQTWCCGWLLLSGCYARWGRLLARERHMRSDTSGTRAAVTRAAEQTDPSLLARVFLNIWVTAQEFCCSTCSRDVCMWGRALGDFTPDSWALISLIMNQPIRMKQLKLTASHALSSSGFFALILSFQALVWRVCVFSWTNISRNLLPISIIFTTCVFLLVIILMISLWSLVRFFIIDLCSYNDGRIFFTHLCNSLVQHHMCFHWPLINKSEITSS